MTVDQVVALATGIIVALSGAVGFLFRAYTQAKNEVKEAKDETIALAKGALVESSLAMRGAADAMVRQAEALSQQAMAVSGLTAAMNAAQSTSSKEHAAVIQEIKAQRREKVARLKAA